MKQHTAGFDTIHRIKSRPDKLAYKSIVITNSLDFTKSAEGKSALDAKAATRVPSIETEKTAAKKAFDVFMKYLKMLDPDWDDISCASSLIPNPKTTMDDDEKNIMAIYRGFLSSLGKDGAPGRATYNKLLSALDRAMEAYKAAFYTSLNSDTLTVQQKPQWFSTLLDLQTDKNTAYERYNLNPTPLSAAYTNVSNAWTLLNEYLKTSNFCPTNNSSVSARYQMGPAGTPHTRNWVEGDFKSYWRPAEDTYLLNGGYDLWNKRFNDLRIALAAFMTAFAQADFARAKDLEETIKKMPQSGMGSTFPANGNGGYTYYWLTANYTDPRTGKTYEAGQYAWVNGKWEQAQLPNAAFKEVYAQYISASAFQTVAAQIDYIFLTNMMYSKNYTQAKIVNGQFVPGTGWRLCSYKFSANTQGENKTFASGSAVYDANGLVTSGDVVAEFGEDVSFGGRLASSFVDKAQLSALEARIKALEDGKPVWKEINKTNIMLSESAVVIASAYYMRIGEFVWVFISTQETTKGSDITLSSPYLLAAAPPPTVVATGTVAGGGTNDDWWVQYQIKGTNSVFVQRQWDSGNWDGAKTKYHIVIAGIRANSNMFP